MRRPGASSSFVRARCSGFRSDRDPASEDVTYRHCSGILRLQARTAFSRKLTSATRFETSAKVQIL
jgi:hypothetical protein